MKTYQRRRTLAEFQTECQRRNWKFDDTRLEAGQSDYVYVEFTVGKVAGHFLLNTFNGNFFGEAVGRGRFNSADEKMESIPFFKELLDAAYTDEPYTHELVHLPT